MVNLTERRWKEIGGQFPRVRGCRELSTSAIKANFELGADLKLRKLKDVAQPVGIDDVAVCYHQLCYGLELPMSMTNTRILSNWELAPGQMHVVYYMVLKRMQVLEEVFKIPFGCNEMMAICKPQRRRAGNRCFYGLSFVDPKIQFFGKPESFKNWEKPAFKVSGSWRLEGFEVRNNFIGMNVKINHRQQIPDEATKRHLKFYYELYKKEKNLFNLSYSDTIVGEIHQKASERKILQNGKLVDVVDVEDEPNSENGEESKVSVMNAFPIAVSFPQEQLLNLEYREKEGAEELESHEYIRNECDDRNFFAGMDYWADGIPYEFKFSEEAVIIDSYGRIWMKDVSLIDCASVVGNVPVATRKRRRMVLPDSDEEYEGVNEAFSPHSSDCNIDADMVHTPVSTPITDLIFIALKGDAEEGMDETVGYEEVTSFEEPNLNKDICGVNNGVCIPTTCCQNAEENIMSLNANVVGKRKVCEYEAGNEGVLGTECSKRRETEHAVDKPSLCPSTVEPSKRQSAKKHMFDDRSLLDVKIDEVRRQAAMVMCVADDLVKLRAEELSLQNAKEIGDQVRLGLLAKELENLKCVNQGLLAEIDCNRKVIGELELKCHEVKGQFDALVKEDTQLKENNKVMEMNYNLVEADYKVVLEDNDKLSKEKTETELELGKISMELYRVKKANDELKKDFKQLHEKYVGEASEVRYISGTGC